jgi:hypothetical protein
MLKLPPHIERERRKWDRANSKAAARMRRYRARLKLNQKKKAREIARQAEGKVLRNP